MGIFTKIFIWPFLCIPRVVLFITTYFGHSTTKNSLKYQIWNFAFWVDKMSQNRAIFFEIAHEVKALFYKMSRHVEKLGSVHTKCQYQITVLGTDPVLEIGTILLHLNGRNFLIPNTLESWLTPHFKGIFMAFPTK